MIVDKKDIVNFRFYNVTAWLKNNCNAHIAQYRKSKGNQKMKFGQLIECNMRNIFLGKSYIKCDRETCPRLFSEKQAADHFLLPHFKLFLRLKICLEIVSPSHFQRNFSREKYFSCYILLIDLVPLSDCLYFVRYWSICALQLFVNQVVTL